MDFLPLKDAVIKYKVSDKTLRTAIANLPPEQRQAHIQTKGNKLLVSLDFLSRYNRRLPPKIKRATATPKAEPTATHTTTPTAEQTTSNELILTSLQNEIQNLHQRLSESNERQKELNYIIANLTKQLASPPATAAAALTDTPGPNTTTDTPFILFVVGFCLGLFVIGLVIWILY